MIPATFADVAASASPAVVNISSQKTVTGFQGFRWRQPERPGGRPDPLEEFFERFFGDDSPLGERREKALGSGFIIDPDGLIITNNHVVENAEDVVVRLSDDREFSAEILGRDPKTDLALIQIEAPTDLPHLELADSDRVRIGDWVLAIGNPFGLEHTVTAGILSARGRMIGAGPYDDFLQTDASINPGNSGGPLLNLQGDVIGINTAIVAGGNGIGFAIPTNMARKIVNQLHRSGRVVRGWLGVLVQEVTPELAESFDLPEAQGALVADVTPGGPAEKAGVHRGDVIVSFNGRPVENWSDLPAMVAETPVGSQVKVVVFRDGRKKTIPVTLGELEDETVAAASTQTPDLGLMVEEVTPELAKSMGLEDEGGVMITSVEHGAPARQSGLRAGDVIVELNRQPIENMADYRRIASEVVSGETVLFLIRRGSRTLFFTVETE
jgi:serine protease Do